MGLGVNIHSIFGLHWSATNTPPIRRSAAESGSGFSGKTVGLGRAAEPSFRRLYERFDSGAGPKEGAAKYLPF